MDKLLPLKTDPLQKDCCKKLRYLCKFASKQEVLTNCCKMETLQMAGKNRGFAKIATKKTETLQPNTITAKERYLKFASNVSHSHNCVTLTFV
jgi:hypothetical protein